MSLRLYVIWQDPETRGWHPVGCLTFDDDEYTFVYTQGALKSERFIPFGSMTDLHAKYYSRMLFPLFANRILSETRPEYGRYLSWMGLRAGEARPLEILARTGGGRATDSLQIYLCPNKNPDGQYEGHFFCHGLRHMPQDVWNYVLTLEQNVNLFPMLDVRNPYDDNAVALRTADPARMIGYVPRYLARDVTRLAVDSKTNFAARVERVNPEAPIQYRLLCHLKADWPDSFGACSDASFEPLHGNAGDPKRNILVNP